MSGYSASNPKELKDLILRRLGAPIVAVEVTEEQIFDCISRAIELFTEYHPDGLNRTFLIVQLTAEQAATGIINIDKPIYAITKILRSGNTFGSMDGSATYNWFTDFVNGLVNFGGGSCYSLFPGGADMTTYYMFQSYYNQLQDMFNPVDDYWYNSTSKMVRIQGNHREGEIVVFEAWATTAMLVDQTATGIAGNTFNVAGSHNVLNSADSWDNPYANLGAYNIAGNGEFYAEQGVYNVRWVKDYATCLVRELQGLILGKHQGMQLPGGVTIDGETITQNAIQEKERLRQELLDITEPLPIMWG